MSLRRTLSSLVAVLSLVAAAPAFAGNGQNLLQYVPENAAVLVNVDLAQVRSLPLYQTIWGLVTADPEVQGVLTEMQTQAGFDPNRDLNGFLMGVNGESENQFLCLVDGTFDTTRINAFLATAPAEELTPMQYGSYTVYHNPTDTAEDAVYFTFINNTTAAFGTQAQLSAALDTAAGGSNITANTAVNNLISSVDTSGAFWFTAAMSPAMQAEMVGSPMAGLASVRGSGNFSGGLNVTYTLTNNTDADATALQTFLNEQMTAARSAPELSAMGLSSILDAVSITASGADVTITASIPDAVLNQIFTMMTALMAAEGGMQ
jgi:hypothetical protein